MGRICKNGLCPLDYPHGHQTSSINSPAFQLRWPLSLEWEKPKRFTHRNSYGGIFKMGWFTSHSGFQLPWKIDLEGLNKNDWLNLADIVASKFAFGRVIGIPKGGTMFAEALGDKCEPGYPTLIVDDVLTTGKSMIQARSEQGPSDPCVGVVVVARGPCPNWVFPILTVNEWSQARGTGLG